MQSCLPLVTTTKPPDDVIDRLRAAEYRQRRLTLRRSLFAEPVDVLAIWTGYCANPDCGAELDVASPWDAKRPPRRYPVIAHVLARGSKGEHSRDNVAIWCWSCNWVASHREKGEIARVKRFEVIKGRPKSGKIKSRGFGKTPKRQWPKRSFGK